MVDLSRAAAVDDMRPNRAAVVGACLHTFIREFFNQNPLSHLGLIVMRNGVAEQLTPLSSSPVRPIASLLCVVLSTFALLCSLHVAVRRVHFLASRSLLALCA